MPITNVLDFEKPLAELDAAIDELRSVSEAEGIDRADEISALEENRDRLARQIFSNLSPWDKTLMARHPNRPYSLDYIRVIFDDFVELHGDRLFADDKAVVGGVGFLDGKPVMVIGQQKGRDIKERQLRNFGSLKPEGFRKAVRLMKMAEKFGRPIVVFVDTPAADCSIGAEERGISEAIARSMMEMALLEVPVIAVVIGEGGSGGALGVGVANRVLMQEHAIYSVIPPEGCAAILSEFDRNPARAPEAADALNITAQRNLELGVIDEVIPEPLGGAHRNGEQAAAAVRDAVVRHLADLENMSPQELAEQRYARFRDMGVYAVEPPSEDESVEEVPG
ncbi:MAG: acetyl-CoA carboxylase carboxyltransferase subunit alpha [Armatimonadetes bacterium]|nr:acetyl-CoA carboxylase carboxyltransferase subunit alpha [Armatimonadota bacterium]